MVKPPRARGFNTLSCIKVSRTICILLLRVADRVADKQKAVFGIRFA